MISLLIDRCVEIENPVLQPCFGPHPRKISISSTIKQEQGPGNIAEFSLNNGHFHNKSRFSVCDGHLMTKGAVFIQKMLIIHRLQTLRKHVQFAISEKL